VLNAREKTVVPGLIETYVHAIGVERDEAVRPFLQPGSIAEIQQWVRKRNEGNEAPPGGCGGAADTLRFELSGYARGIMGESKSPLGPQWVLSGAAKTVNEELINRRD
jgi:hypothetical protein